MTAAHTFGVLVCFVLTAAPAPAQDQATGQRSGATEPAVLLPQPNSPTTPTFTRLFGADGEAASRARPDSAPLLSIDDLAPGRPSEAIAVPRASVSGFRFAPQPPQQPPEPRHTGFKALLFETGGDFKAFPRRRSTWVILGIGAGAAAAAYPADDEVNAHLMGSDAVDRFFAPGKWIGSAYVQAGAAVGLYVIGRYALPHADGEARTNKVSHLGFDMLRALIVSQTFTQAIKNTVRRDRPTGECCAFPSGHASATFATASVLERHFGPRGSWPVFLVASYVATSRLHEDRHFLSDVIFGASLGVASGWTVVGRHGRSSYALMPVPIRGGVMVTLIRDSRGQTLQVTREHQPRAEAAVSPELTRLRPRDDSAVRDITLDADSAR
jgi:membrane-associated phospholipid phosphatase